MEGKHTAEFPESSELRTFMARCQDPEARARGLAELQAELAALAAASNPSELARQLGHLRAMGNNILVLFVPSPVLVAGRLTLQTQVGLTGPILPGFLYSPMRQAVQDNHMHWRTLAQISGLASDQEAQEAAQVDRWLALMLTRSVPLGHSISLVDRAALERQRFPWAAYFDGLGQPVAGSFALAASQDLARVDGLLSLPLGTIKSYARVLLIERYAELLTQPMLDEEYRHHFLPSRYVMVRSWSLREACSGMLPRSLYAQIGFQYLSPLANGENQRRADLLLSALRARLIDRLLRAPLPDGTLQDATVARVRQVTPIFLSEMVPAPPPPAPMGGPSFLALYRQIRQEETARELARSGRPWRAQFGDASFSTAAYLPEANRVWLSPELQREPYLTAPPWGAATYGGLGFAIGHELGHILPGTPWLVSASRTSVASTLPGRAWYSCVGRLFSGLAASGKVSFDLERSLGEYMPDLVGLSLALEEMERAAITPAGAESSVERLQTFFVAFAQGMCAYGGDDRSTLWAFVDEHPSILLRINGVVSQSAAFARAFACRAGQPMAPEPRCTPW